MTRRLLRLFSILIVASVFSLLTLGQGTTAPLSGSVLDPNGAVISGASVIELVASFSPHKTL